MINGRNAAVLAVLAVSGCSWSMKPPPSAPVTLYTPNSDGDGRSNDYDSCSSSYRLPIVDTVGAVVLGALSIILNNSATSGNQRRDGAETPWPVFAVAGASVVYAVSAVRGFVVGQKCNCYLRSIGEIE
ncbi:MAG: hypothetical protein KBG15_09580 [Kofleriaceae bacterium]|nr:hypothetical protein [Kofleriaceae bacterium]